MKSIAIIIPALNEAASIDANISEILRHLRLIPELRFTLVVVNDGSTDDTADIMLRRSQLDHNVRVLSLSRHFGKEAAIHAGLMFARDFDAAIVMDSDLQHPPALLQRMTELWQEGSLVVEACKESRGTEALSRGLLVRSYYCLFNFLTRLGISGGTDFKLLDRRAVQAYCALPERNRFFRGLIKWLNFPTARIPFDVPVSARSGSSWGNLDLFRYAISSITSFTAFPLQVVTFLGGLTFLVSLLVGGIALYDKLSGEAVDGFTTVILLILLIGSILMFSVGLIGIYIGKIYDEIKQRPAYVVDEQKSNVGDMA